LAGNSQGFSIPEYTSIAEIKLQYTNSRLLQDKAETGLQQNLLSLREAK